MLMLCIQLVVFPPSLKELLNFFGYKMDLASCSLITSIPMTNLGTARFWWGSWMEGNCCCCALCFDLCVTLLIRRWEKCRAGLKVVRLKTENKDVITVWLCTEAHLVESVKLILPVFRQYYNYWTISETSCRLVHYVSSWDSTLLVTLWVAVLDVIKLYTFVILSCYYYIDYYSSSKLHISFTSHSQTVTALGLAGC